MMSPPLTGIRMLLTVVELARGTTPALAPMTVKSAPPAGRKTLSFSCGGMVPVRTNQAVSTPAVGTVYDVPGGPVVWTSVKFDPHDWVGRNVEPMRVRADAGPARAR